MLRFRKKRKEENESEKAVAAPQAGTGRAMLETVKTGLNSQWFVSKKYSVLKELEGAEQQKGVIDDRSRERAIASILGSLEGALETFSAENDQEGLKDTAGLFLTAYTKIGDPALLDRYTSVCIKVGITEEERAEKILVAADEAGQIDIAVTLYARAKARERLLGAGNKALNLYLGDNDLDMDSRSRLFDYVVKAYEAAYDKDALVQAGDQALKSQIDSQRLSREEGWIFDAQKAYQAADDKKKLSKLADQYVNLYFKEGLDIWLDKAIVAYEEAEVDSSDRLNGLADKLEEKGQAGMADTLRRKAGK